MLSLGTGAGSVAVKNIANANMAEMALEGGAASYAVDFGGKLQRSGHVRITSGVSSVTVTIPGTTAARLYSDSVLGSFNADEGFVGPRDAIGGAEGFLATMTDDASPEELLADWAERPAEVRNTGIKAHACCRYNQGPLDAILEIRRAHDVVAAQAPTRAAVDHGVLAGGFALARDLAFVLGRAVDGRVLAGLVCLALDVAGPSVGAVDRRLLARAGGAAVDLGPAGACGDQGCDLSG